MNVVLSDGSVARFENCTESEFEEKRTAQTLEGKIYKELLETLSQKDIQKHIQTDFPEASIHRRNTGYAVDELIKMQPFASEGTPLNLSKLLAGSEGTLGFYNRNYAGTRAFTSEKYGDVGFAFQLYFRCHASSGACDAAPSLYL
jgi:hypothetical protein